MTKDSVLPKERPYIGERTIRLHETQDVEEFLKDLKYRRKVKVLHTYFGGPHDFLIHLHCPKLLKIILHGFTNNALSALAQLKAPNLHHVSLSDGHVFSGPMLNKTVEMPTVRELTIAGWPVIKDLKFLSRIKFPALEELSITHHATVKSLEGIEAAAGTLKSISIQHDTQVSSEIFDGSGFNATFPFLKRVFFDCPIKDFSIFKEMIAPTLGTLELSCVFFDLDFNNENIFQGLIDMQAPELRSVTLDVWVNAKRFDEKEFEKKMASLTPRLTKLNHAFKTFKKQFIQKYPLEGNPDRSSVDFCVTITVSVFETDKEKVLDVLKTNIDSSIAIKFHIIETPSAEPIS